MPKDDIYIPQESIQKVVQAHPTVHQFIPLDQNKPWKFVSMQDIHGNSSAAKRIDNTNYTAKIPNRYNNINYMSQW